MYTHTNIVMMLFSGSIGYVCSKMYDFSKVKTQLVVLIACYGWVGFIGLDIYDYVFGDINSTWHLVFSILAWFINSVILLLIVLKDSLPINTSWLLFQISASVWLPYITFSLLNCPIYIGFLIMAATLAMLKVALVNHA